MQHTQMQFNSCSFNRIIVVTFHAPQSTSSESKTQLQIMIQLMVEATDIISQYHLKTFFPDIKICPPMTKYPLNLFFMS